MKVLSLQAIYPRPRPTTPDPQHRVYPYLLRGLIVDRPDQARCSDITYLPMPSGLVYLVAVMDWVSRYALAWRVSNTLLPLYNLERPHQAFDYETPSDVYHRAA